MIGLSTSWLTERPNITGIEIVQEIVGLGFEAVELEYRIGVSTFEEILPLILKERLKVWSIHNFFPLPPGLPLCRASGDLYLLSSPDPEERNLAVRETSRTIELAQGLGASAVVLHLGRVEMDPEYGRLNRLFSEGRLGTAEGRSFLERKLKERREKRKPYLEAVFKSLDRLAREAQGRGILLGVENRYHYHEIPDFEEMGGILDRFTGGPVRYWHDVGHAHVQEKLGFVRPGALLGNYGDRLAGVHIHDSLGTDDHRAPGTGEIDFPSLGESLKRAEIRILEVHQKSSREELVRGVEMLRAMGLS
ncbi:MAG: sugar phosphate isomerase/epimerase [Deltaproteobacteria bacterium]|nr:sugar phosphate isomerase/epimerase [Deltaproteobacteria bacterium]